MLHVNHKNRGTEYFAACSAGSSRCHRFEYREDFRDGIVLCPESSGLLARGWSPEIFKFPMLRTQGAGESNFILIHRDNAAQIDFLGSNT